MARIFDRNLALRVASAVVGLPLLGAVVWRRDTFLLAALTTFITAGALHEVGRLLLGDARRRDRVMLVFLGAAVHAAIYLRPAATLPALMVGPVILGAFALTGASPDLPRAVERMTGAAFGLLYVPPLLAALPLLHRDFPFGRLWVVTAIAVTFVSDSAAFFVGKALGRRKLLPAVSPGKTVEGALGGLLGAFGFLWLARATYFDTLRPGDCWAVGLLAGTVGPIGDLVESMLKRAVGAKDSGRLIPGHGGLLDRIDALLFVGASVYVYVAWLR